MLSCDCSYDGEDWVEPFDDFQTLSTKRKRRCQSCEKDIACGEMCLPFRHYRSPNSFYEERRFGDQVDLADKYLCESCGEIWMNLSELGFCLTLGSDMREALQDYQAITGFDPAKYQEAEL